ncbi:MAG: hypothetical protein GY832_26180 [Chloroflexi bacterium]|nr:hypothetical protein [Chloroflexota bacterium]
MFTPEVKNIRIVTLEKKSGLDIEDWIAFWNDEDEPVRRERFTDRFDGSRLQLIIIGEEEYLPIKWKCPECGRWNYELSFWDNSGAMAVCDYCHADGEF